MSTESALRPAQAADEQAPDWSPIATEEGRRRSPRAGVAMRALVAAAVGAVLWWLAHPLGAVVLWTVVGIATVASLLRPSIAEALDRATHAVERAAGRGLNLLVLGVLELLIFTPLWALGRLVRHDPLALGLPRDATSFWRPHPARRGRPLHRRPFSYERFDQAHGSSRGGRLRAAAGVAALLIAADIAAGAAIHGADGTGDAAPAGQRQSLLFTPDAAAGRDETWLPELAREIDDVWYAKLYDPYLGWTLADYSGSYVHVADGVRHGYEPTPAGGGPAIRVFFFGGSTTFGLFQRDEHTIPSEVARLAEADGVRLRVSNYGTLAYNNWQELQRLEQLLSAGQRPDLAVFYDGNNELVSQFRLGPHSVPAHQEAGEFAERIGLTGSAPATTPRGEQSPLRALADAWEDASAASWLARRVSGRPTEDEPPTRPLVSPWAADQRKQARDVGRQAAALHARGVEVASRLADAYGFEAAFFWQPSLYTKPLVDGEQAAQGSLGTDPTGWTEANAVARTRLDRRVVDIADALDSARSPVMYDFVHTNEAGARVVARAIYRELKPRLATLAARSEP